jgi:hypothetical protein
MAPHLSCENNKVQCKVQDHNLDLAPTSTKLIMGDGRTIIPLGIACNINVIMLTVNNCIKVRL